MTSQSSLRIARENSTLRQQVVEQLRNAVLGGVFAPGQKLVERDLCEQLGISRTVLREALQHLGAEGLITNIPHKGPTVASITRKEAEDIYEVRAALEGLAGRGFALNAKPDQVLALKQALAELEAVQRSPAGDALIQAKNAFYRILTEGSGNDVIASMLTLLNNRITLLRRLSLSETGRLPATLAELRAIVEAIEHCQPDLVQQLCQQHVRTAAQAALKHLPEQPSA